MPVTLANIAQACGVSTSTVSLALRDHPRIPAATKARIKAAADRLGYVPNRSISRVMAEIRAGGRTRTFKESLGYFTADVKDRSREYEQRLFAGAEARASEIGYGLDRFELGKHGLSLSQLGKVLASRGIRGLILAPWPEAHVELELEWKGLASVAIGYSLEKPEIHRVTRNVMHTLRSVFPELVAQGYRRIGFVMERSHEERMEYMTLAAFQLHAFLTPENDRVPALVENNLEEGVFNKWVAANEPDIIFTMHRPVLDWLQSSGYRVPEEVGVFYFNCEGPDSQLSGIYPAYENIGAAAVDQVAALVERGGFGIPDCATTVTVPGIPCRGSTLRNIQ